MDFTRPELGGRETGQRESRKKFSIEAMRYMEKSGNFTKGRIKMDSLCCKVSMLRIKNKEQRIIERLNIIIIYYTFNIITSRLFFLNKNKINAHNVLREFHPPIGWFPPSQYWKKHRSCWLLKEGFDANRKPINQ